MKKMIRKKKVSRGFPFLTLLVTSFIAFAIIVLAVSNIRIYEKRADLQRHTDEKEAELEMLRERMNQTYNLSLDGPDDDFMIEKMAREQLLLKKPGEEVVFITFPENDSIESIEDNKKELRWWNPFTWYRD